MDLVFVHGWASGFFVWRNVANKFPDHQCHLIDLGFIGTEKLQMPKSDFIGIGHSLGGQWLLKHYPNQMKGFISIASFNNFYNYVPEQIISTMNGNVIKNAHTQIAEFWHHAGLDNPDGFKNINALKLIEGLNWLSKWDCPIPSKIPVMAMASKDDRVVSAKMTKKIWGQNDLRWSDNGGHMLPITKAEWCVDNIQSFLDEISV